ncbi:MAG TPA: SulP family inorganic anion transporter, partial [Solirubrobacteraceae bacterium]
VGGIVVGLLGGSALQVSGPAAGLTVTTLGLIATYGWPATGAIVAAAGVVQIAFGASRIARWVLTVSPSIVHGMLAGIGMTILLAQLHVVMGGKPLDSAFDNLLALPARIFGGLSHDVTVGVVTLSVLLVWSKLSGRLGKLLPAPLLAVLAGAALAAAAGWDVTKPNLPGNILAHIGLPDVPAGGFAGIAAAVLTVALVASLESLLSALAVDKLHRQTQRADLDRELMGQGAANVCSGMIGGLPVTGVIVRSTANVTAGARTRASAVLHGVWIVVFVVFLGGLIEFIPLAALAALLVLVGARLLDLGNIRYLGRHRELPTYIITMVGVMAFGLLEGVLAGIVLAVGLALHRQSHVTVAVERHGNRHDVTVEGSLTFLTVPKLVDALSEAVPPPGAEVSLHLNVDFLDHAAFEAIDAWISSSQRSGGSVEIHEMYHDWYLGAAAGMPIGRRQPAPPPQRWPLPWSHRRSSRRSSEPSSRTLVRKPQRPGDALQSSIGHDPDPEISLRHGIQEFRQHYAPRVASVLAEQVQHGQDPSQLFIACSDSRVVPSLITASGPGDLFSVHNVGNIVPPYDARHAAHPKAGPRGDTSVGAAIEYAVDVLCVRAITVCGHSDCGAMKALVAAQTDGGAPPGTMLPHWLQSGNVQDITDLSDSDERASHDVLSQANVVRQLDNLLTYPSVQAAIAERDLQLIGLYFDISTAEVHFFDQTRDRFVLPEVSTTVD